MGTWKIEIHGHGIHHNRRGDDANVMGAHFGASLRAAGHDVSSARFILTNTDGSPTPDGGDDILDAGAYLAERGPKPAAGSPEHILQFFAYELPGAPT